MDELTALIREDRQRSLEMHHSVVALTTSQATLVERVAIMAEKVEQLAKASSDHEGRLRSAERYIAMIGGAGGILGLIISLVNLLKK